MNALLSQLDRRLKRRGEPVWLQRTTGTNKANVRAQVPAIVRTLMAEQLIGSITQQNYFILVSPTHLWDHRQWPGGQTPNAPLSGIIEPRDPRIPTNNDAIFVRGSQRAIQNVQPVFDKGVCIRIEISCLG
jgi:hypothetical protein